MMAAAKLGLIIVNINPASRKHELQHALNLVECKGIVIVPEFKTTNYVQMIYDLCPGLEKRTNTEGQYPTVDSEVLPHLRHVIYCSHVGEHGEKHNGLINFDNLLNLASPKSFSFPKVTHHHNDIINIQFTSGKCNVVVIMTII